MFATSTRPARGALGFAARLLPLLAALCLWAAAPARADVTTLDGLDAPIVRINVRRGDVTVRTWDRPTVAIDGDPSLVIERKASREAPETHAVLIPQAQAPSGDGPVMLAAESFVVSVPPGAREQVVVKSPPLPIGASAPTTRVSVMIPSDAVFVFAHTANGNLDVHDYRQGTLVGFVGNGRLSLDAVGGTVFAQTGRGPLAVTDSTIDRLRARSLFGNLTFERCRLRQIEATTVAGSIVYDRGSFEPGLARFESTRGNIAIGTVGPAEIGAHAVGGKVYTSYEGGARIEGRDGDASAAVAGGGPVVTATTEGGNVFLYDGSLRTRAESLPAPWQAPLATLQRPIAPFRPFRPLRPESTRRFYAPRRPYQPRPPAPKSPWDRFNEHGPPKH